MDIASDALERLPVAKQTIEQMIGDRCIRILPASARIMSLLHHAIALLIKYIISCICTSPFVPSHLSSFSWMYVVIILVAP